MLINIVKYNKVLSIHNNSTNTKFSNNLLQLKVRLGVLAKSQVDRNRY